MKKILKGLLILLLIIVAIVWFAFANLETIVKKAVNKFGSEAVGTQVVLDGFKLSILNGEVTLKGLTVANPKGYEKPYLFSLDKVFVKVDIKSLMKDTIIVDEITIDAPTMTYEMASFTKNNISDIMANLDKGGKAPEKAQAPAKTETAEASAKPAKKVIINKVSVNATAVDAAIKLPEIPGVYKSQTVSQAITLPNIVIKDIGREKNGANMVDAGKIIFKRVLSETTAQVGKIVNKASDFAREQAEKALGMAKDKANEAVNQAKDKAESQVNDAKEKLLNKLPF